MCDSDDPVDGEPGVDLGFLFGNIDERGQLEDDGLLDKESKRMLSSLHRFGFGSMLSEVLDKEEVSKEDEEKGKERFSDQCSCISAKYCQRLHCRSLTYI